MRKRKDYKDKVAKVYAEASKNEINWPDSLMASIANQEYKNYFNNIPKGSGGYYHFIKLLVEEIKPKIVVELGSHYGLGILAVMASLPEKSKLVTVDNVTNLAGVSKEILADPRLRYVPGDCLDLAIYKDDIPKDIDLLVCDTIHI